MTSEPAGPDAVLRALADPHRRQILRLVRDTELPAGQIASHFELTQQAVSLHISVMKRAGLLTERREGTRRLYSLRAESLRPLRTLLDEFWPDALARLKQTVEQDQSRREELTNVITASVRIAAPPEVVFPYFTDPQLMIRWIGDQVDLDARPGGRFALDFSGVSARGLFVEVEPPHRAVFTWGIPDDPEMPAGSSTVEVVLVADGDDTIVHLSHRDLPEDREPSHLEGWERCFAELAAAVRR